LKGEYVLELISVSKTYNPKKGSVKALDSVSLRLKEGGLYGVMGPSGSGKTTLLKVSSGLLKPDSGSVKLFDVNLYEVSRDERRRIRRTLTSFMFQEDLLIETLTLKENVELPLVIRGVERRVREELALKALESVGLRELADRKPIEVSGGEGRRTSLARCLVNNPKIMFLDEPTSNLDSKTALDMIDILKTINMGGVTILISTHDPLIADRLDERFFMRDGKIRRRDEIECESSL